MQIMMTGFLGKTKARSFMGELWNLMIDAQENTHGIPTELIEQKKAELLKKSVSFKFGFWGRKKKRLNVPNINDRKSKKIYF